LREQRVDHVALFVRMSYSSLQPPAVEELIPALNSWVKWLEEWLLRSEKLALNLCVPSFFLSLMAEKAPHLLVRLANLIISEQLGLVAVLEGNNLIEMSSRLDDFYYQLKQYAFLLAQTLGVRPSRWEGIFYSPGPCGEYSLWGVVQAAAEVKAFPLLIVPGASLAEENFSEVSLGRYLSLQTREIGDYRFFMVPVHYRFNRLRISPASFLYQLKSVYEEARENDGGVEAPLVVVECDFDFAVYGHEQQKEQQKRVAELCQLLLSEPGFRLVKFRDYYRDKYAAGRSWVYSGLPGREVPGYRRIWHSLKDLEKQQERIETLVLWALRERFPQIKEWLDLVGFGVFISNRRYEIIEHLLSRYFPQARGRAYRILNRIRNQLYPAYASTGKEDSFFAPWPFNDYSRCLTVLQLAHRLAAAMLLLFRGKNTELRQVERRDWDGDGQEELVVLTDQQMMVLNPVGGVIYHQVNVPGLPVAPAELAMWLESMLNQFSWVTEKEICAVPTIAPDFWRLEQIEIWEEGEQGWIPVNMRLFSPPHVTVTEGEDAVSISVTQRGEVLLSHGVLLFLVLQKNYRLQGELLDIAVEASVEGGPEKIRDAVLFLELAVAENGKEEQKKEHCRFNSAGRAWVQISLMPVWEEEK